MKMRGLGLGVAVDLAGFGQLQVVGQGQAGAAEHADLEEVAPPDAVASLVNRHTFYPFRVSSPEHPESGGWFIVEFGSGIRSGRRTVPRPSVAEPSLADSLSG